MAVNALDEYIEILKQDLLFAMDVTERLKPEITIGIHKIATIKREIDKAVQEKMKLSRIYCNYDSNSDSVVPQGLLLQPLVLSIMK